VDLRPKVAISNLFLLRVFVTSNKEIEMVESLLFDGVIGSINHRHLNGMPRVKLIIILKTRDDKEPVLGFHRLDEKVTKFLLLGLRGC
jgi:hypothetical protein